MSSSMILGQLHPSRHLTGRGLPSEFARIIFEGDRLRLGGDTGRWPGDNTGE